MGDKQPFQSQLNILDRSLIDKHLLRLNLDWINISNGL